MCSDRIPLNKNGLFSSAEALGALQAKSARQNSCLTALLFLVTDALHAVECRLEAQNIVGQPVLRWDVHGTTCFPCSPCARGASSEVLIPPWHARARSDGPLCVQASDPAYSDDASVVTGKTHMAINHDKDMAKIFSFQ